MQLAENTPIKLESFMKKKMIPGPNLDHSCMGDMDQRQFCKRPRSLYT